MTPAISQSDALRITRNAIRIVYGGNMTAYHRPDEERPALLKCSQCYHEIDEGAFEEGERCPDEDCNGILHEADSIISINERVLRRALEQDKGLTLSEIAARAFPNKH